MHRPCSSVHPETLLWRPRPQASKDCVQKTIKRLEEKITGKVLHQILYTMYSSERVIQQRVATALTRLAHSNDLKQVQE